MIQHQRQVQQLIFQGQHQHWTTMPEPQMLPVANAACRMPMSLFRIFSHESLVISQVRFLIMSQVIKMNSSHNFDQSSRALTGACIVLLC